MSRIVEGDLRGPNLTSCPRVGLNAAIGFCTSGASVGSGLCVVSLSAGPLGPFWT